MEEVDEGVDSEVVGVVEAVVVVVALEEGGVVVLEVDVVVGVVDLEVEEVGVVDLVEEEVVALGEVEVAAEDQTDSGERERENLFPSRFCSILSTEHYCVALHVNSIRCPTPIIIKSNTCFFLSIQARSFQRT